jgi:hypothetical protein
MATRSIICLILVSMPAATANAQVPTPLIPVVEFEEELDFSRPEAWAMKYFGSMNLLTGFGAPRAIRPGAIDLGLEIDWVPSLSDAERTVGFEGTKMEDLNKTSVFLRPWVVFGLPRDFSLTLTYVPPINAFGVKPHLFGAAIGKPVYQADRWRIGLRGYGQFGTIEGDFTCDEDTVAAGSDPIRNPFDCKEVSEDKYTLGSLGVEASAAWQADSSGKLEPHVGLAVNYMDADFQVNARYAGLIDRTLLLADGFTVSFTAGVTFAITDRFSVSGDVFYSPLDVVRPPSTTSQNDGLFNVRSLITYRIR